MHCELRCDILHMTLIWNCIVCHIKQIWNTPASNTFSMGGRPGLIDYRQTLIIGMSYYGSVFTLKKERYQVPAISLLENTPRNDVSWIYGRVWVRIRTHPKSKTLLLSSLSVTLSIMWPSRQFSGTLDVMLMYGVMCNLWRNYLRYNEDTLREIEAISYIFSRSTAANDHGESYVKNVVE